MTAATIYPTGTCFDDALDLVVHFVSLDPRKEDTLILVHAICLIPEGPDEGRPFAHAWLEEGDQLWQAGFLDGMKIQYSADRDEVRTGLRVQEETRYTVRQAHEENRRSNMYGPWVEKYRALCRNPDAPNCRPRLNPAIGSDECQT